MSQRQKASSIEHAILITFFLVSKSIRGKLIFKHLVKSLPSYLALFTKTNKTRQSIICLMSLKLFLLVSHGVIFVQVYAKPFYPRQLLFLKRSFFRSVSCFTLSRFSRSDEIEARPKDVSTPLLQKMMKKETRAILLWNPASNRNAWTVLWYSG